MTLTPEEIESLMEAMQDGLLKAPPRPGEERPAQSYDLLNPERRLPTAMQALDGLHEETAYGLGSFLASRVRRRVSVRCEPSRSLPLQELPPTLASPTLMARLELSRGSQPGFLLIDELLGRKLVLVALGAELGKPGAEELEAESELTRAELRVLARLLQAFTAAMTRAWEPVLPLRAEILGIEPALRVATALMADDMVVQTAFEVNDGDELQGRLQLCLPRGIVEKLAEVAAARTSGGGSQDAKQLRDEIGEVDLDVRVELGATRMSLRRLLQLAEGDVLVLGQGESAPLPVLFEGRPKLLGRPRSAGGGLSVVIEGPWREAPTSPAAGGRDEADRPDFETLRQLAGPTRAAPSGALRKEEKRAGS